MKSPITGKEMNLCKEQRSLDFRKESFDVIFHFYKCEESGEQFTSHELDEVNLNQVYNQYRDRHNIPFPEEIIRIREKYQLSASKMSMILGFGANSYRKYESGEMPSVSNARLIQMIDDPSKFLDMLVLCDELDEKTKGKLSNRAQEIIEERAREQRTFDLKEYLLGNHLADEYTGYRNPNFAKFTEMVVFFSEHLQPFKTKMNKLLFYADFLMFKQSCFSISGIRYRALDMGPVPNNFQSLFEYLANRGEIAIRYVSFAQGYTGEQFEVGNNRTFNSELFNENELAILHKVAEAFKTSATQHMVESSHLEAAWKSNEKERGVISYNYAFELSQI